MSRQADLFEPPPTAFAPRGEDIVGRLGDFTWRGRPTTVTPLATAGASIPVLTNEFWTSKQRDAHSLHEISYRACFKPQLPAFFIERLTEPGDVVYDPFAGRGTTLIESALLGRSPAGCDVNPLSGALVLPRLRPPAPAEVLDRLAAIDLRWDDDVRDDLLVFYHPATLSELCALRRYLMDRVADGTLDDVDAWIRMVTINRLTGHSPGFLSVYTLPPNQAVSIGSQRKINAERKQSPPRRDLRRIVLKKSASLLADVDTDTRNRLAAAREALRFRTGSCDDLFWADGSVDLIVTSPPFLDVVDYATDNWLRCWFFGIESTDVPIALWRRLDDWVGFVTGAFRQFARLLKPGGFVAFEVGEVRRGKVRLEETVVPCGVAAGLTPVAVVVNQQAFTKTANIWGVANNAKGTNSNRIVLLRRPPV